MPTIVDLNEQARPKAPKITGASDAQRAQGRRLALIHKMHLRDVADIQRLVEKIDHNRAEAATLAEKIAGLDIMRNLQTFGAICGQECNNLFYHHNAEEQQIFPEVEIRGGAGFAPVIAKLRAEHVVIHALLEALSAGAQKLISEPDDAHYTALRETFSQLRIALKSHFHYEETELEEALGVFHIL